MQRLTRYLLFPIVLAGLFLPASHGWHFPAQAQTPATRSHTSIMMVKLHADWCGTCRQVDGIMKNLRQTYRKVPGFRYVELDISDQRRLSRAHNQAEKLGISGWLHQNQNTVPVVGIFSRPDNHLLYQFINETDPKIYQQAVREALSHP